MVNIIIYKYHNQLNLIFAVIYKQKLLLI